MKKIPISRICLVIIAFFLIFFSGYQLLNIHSDYRKGEVLYESARDEFTQEEDKNEITIDFDKLQKVNRDIVGWIYFENEDISYPVLYSGDNEKYLRMSFSGEQVQAGSIFMEGANNPSFADSHTIIYGHNMANLSMFGKLKYYWQEPDYYENHQYFRIITPDKSYRYKIISYKEVNGNSDIYKVDFESKEAFIDFARNILLADSQGGEAVNLTKKSKIITLSTCSEGSGRFIVSAVRVKDE